MRLLPTRKQPRGVAGGISTATLMMLRVLATLMMLRVLATPMLLLVLASLMMLLVLASLHFSIRVVGAM